MIHDFEIDAGHRIEKGRLNIQRLQVQTVGTGNIDTHGHKYPFDVLGQCRPIIVRQRLREPSVTHPSRTIDQQTLRCVIDLDRMHSAREWWWRYFVKSAGLNKFRVVGQAKNGQLEIIVDGSTASVYSVKRQRQNVVRKGGICGNKMPSPSCASGRQRGGNVK